MISIEQILALIINKEGAKFLTAADFDIDLSDMELAIELSPDGSIVAIELREKDEIDEQEPSTTGT